MLHKFGILVFMALICKASYSQIDATDSVVAAFIPSITYSYQFAGGDLAKQYGNNSTIGGGFKYKTSRNWLWSLDANFIFGNKIKNSDSILRMVFTNDEYIIDGNGTYALYTLYERGYNVTFSTGKILPVLKVNPNSGLMITAGVGFLVHRMKIDNQHKTAPQIVDDYARGYDRLTAGFSLNEFIGYFYMGNSKLLNFYAGFEFVQGFTKSQRDWIFDEMRKDNSNHLDLFYGIKVGWILPIYNRAPDKYYYN
ncbi:MAG: hypothetical protein CVT99_06900 [Bacteroidetes bacterium HGW-Bacteroidetes-16]|jgi:hypothetical protein|nr:MAG: hypothetical protein CVT99_06900 [Bacteroidetes bacterium HGW-Bacteroidetes-16]